MRIFSILCVIVVLLAGCESSEGTKCSPGYPDCPTAPQPRTD